MELEKDMEHLSGIMVKFSKDSGKMELKMDMELGNRRREISMRVSGR